MTSFSSLQRNYDRLLLYVQEAKLSLG